MAHESSWIQSFPKALGDMPWSTSYIHCIFWSLVFVMITFLIFTTSFSHFISKLQGLISTTPGKPGSLAFGARCHQPFCHLPSLSTTSTALATCTALGGGGNARDELWDDEWRRWCFGFGTAVAEGHDDLESDGGIEGAFVGMGGGGCKIVGWFDLCPKNWVFEGEKEFGEKRSFFGVQCENGIFSLEEGHEVDERTPRLMHQPLQAENQYICQLKCDPYLEDHPI